MVSEDYESVVETMRLKDGLAWSLPITLPASEEEADGIRVGEEIALSDEAGRVLATMILEDRYAYDKEHEARVVYGTTNAEHPGVAAVYRQKDVLLGGEVTLSWTTRTRSLSRATTTSRAAAAGLRREGLEARRRFPDP